MPGRWSDVAFTNNMLEWEWRVPREVVPLDVAVAVAYETAIAVHKGASIGVGIRDFLAAKLREMSEEELCN